jgi:hypothetical protein
LNIYVETIRIVGLVTTFGAIIHKIVQSRGRRADRYMSQYERAMELDEEDIDHILESEEDFPGFAKVLSIPHTSSYVMLHRVIILGDHFFFAKYHNIYQESAPAGAAYFPQGY